MRKGLLIVAGIILALILFLFVVLPKYTPFMHENTVREYPSQNSENKESEPEKIYATADDIDIKLKWKSFSSYDNAKEEDICPNGYDRADIVATIYLSNKEVTESYTCESINEHNSDKSSFEIGATTGFYKETTLAMNQKIKNEQSFRICCESEDGKSQFCKTINLEAYC